MHSFRICLRLSFLCVLITLESTLARVDLWAPSFSRSLKDIEEEVFVNNTSLFAQSLDHGRFDHYAAFLLQNLQREQRGFEHLRRLQLMINSSNSVVREVEASPLFDTRGGFTPLTSVGDTSREPVRQWLRRVVEASNENDLEIALPHYIIVTSANHYQSFAYSMVDAQQEMADVPGLLFVLLSTSRPRYSDMFNSRDKNEWPAPMPVLVRPQSAPPLFPSAGTPSSLQLDFALPTESSSPALLPAYAAPASRVLLPHSALLTAHAHLANWLAHRGVLLSPALALSAHPLAGTFTPYHSGGSGAWALRSLSTQESLYGNRHAHLFVMEEVDVEVRRLLAAAEGQGVDAAHALHMRVTRQRSTNLSSVGDIVTASTDRDSRASHSAPSGLDLARVDSHMDVASAATAAPTAPPNAATDVDVDVDGPDVADVAAAADSHSKLQPLFAAAGAGTGHATEVTVRALTGSAQGRLVAEYIAQVSTDGISDEERARLHAAMDVGVGRAGAMRIYIGSVSEVYLAVFLLLTNDNWRTRVYSCQRVRAHGCSPFLSRAPTRSTSTSTASGRGAESIMDPYLFHGVDIAAPPHARAMWTYAAWQPLLDLLPPLAHIAALQPLSPRYEAVRSGRLRVDAAGDSVPVATQADAGSTAPSGGAARVRGAPLEGEGVVASVLPRSFFRTALQAQRRHLRVDAAHVMNILMRVAARSMLPRSEPLPAADKVADVLLLVRATAWLSTRRVQDDYTVKTPSPEALDTHSQGISSGVDYTDFATLGHAQLADYVHAAHAASAASDVGESHGAARAASPGAASVEDVDVLPVFPQPLRARADSGGSWVHPRYAPLLARDLSAPYAVLDLLPHTTGGTPARRGAWEEPARNRHMFVHAHSLGHVLVPALAGIAWDSMLGGASTGITVDAYQHSQAFADPFVAGPAQRHTHNVAQQLTGASYHHPRAPYRVGAGLAVPAGGAVRAEPPFVQRLSAYDALMRRGYTRVAHPAQLAYLDWDAYSAVAPARGLPRVALAAVFTHARAALAAEAGAPARPLVLTRMSRCYFPVRPAYSAHSRREAAAGAGPVLTHTRVLARLGLLQGQLQGMRDRDARSVEVQVDARGNIRTRRVDGGSAEPDTVAEAAAMQALAPGAEGVAYGGLGSLLHVIRLALRAAAAPRTYPHTLRYYNISVDVGILHDDTDHAATGLAATPEATPLQQLALPAPSAGLLTSWTGERAVLRVALGASTATLEQLLGRKEAGQDTAVEVEPPAPAADASGSAAVEVAARRYRWAVVHGLRRVLAVAQAALPTASSATAYAHTEPAVTMRSRLPRVVTEAQLLGHTFALQVLELLQWRNTLRREGREHAWLRMLPEGGPRASVGAWCSRARARADDAKDGAQAANTDAVAAELVVRVCSARAELADYIRAVTPATAQGAGASGDAPAHATDTSSHATSAEAALGRSLRRYLHVLAAAADALATSMLACDQCDSAAAADFLSALATTPHAAAAHRARLRAFTTNATDAHGPSGLFAPQLSEPLAALQLSLVAESKLLRLRAAEVHALEGVQLFAAGALQLMATCDDVLRTHSTAEAGEALAHVFANIRSSDVRAYAEDTLLWVADGTQVAETGHTVMYARPHTQAHNGPALPLLLAAAPTLLPRLLEAVYLRPPAPGHEHGGHVDDVLVRALLGHDRAGLCLRLPSVCAWAERWTRDKTPSSGGSDELPWLLRLFYGLPPHERSGQHPIGGGAPPSTTSSSITGSSDALQHALSVIQEPGWQRQLDEGISRTVARAEGQGLSSLAMPQPGDFMVLRPVAQRNGTEHVPTNLSEVSALKVVLHSHMEGGVSGRVLRQWLTAGLDKLEAAVADAQAVARGSHAGAGAAAG